MSRGRSGPLLAVLLVLLGALLGGCVSLPTKGPVQVGPSPQQPGEDAPFDFNPGGPNRGATPVDIVNGFLLAMQATPLRTDVARQFLTAGSSATWAPERGTVVHGSLSVAPAGSVVRLVMHDVVRLDSRGKWLGDPTGGRGLQYRLHLVRERGQWRISNPPDALIIPRSHFDTWFSQYLLYFFDESAQVLVPEPVYLPRGDQAPTLLVKGLLGGVDPDLAGTERTFIPSRTQLDLSVPVTRDGVAEVPLSGDVLKLSAHDLDLAVAQLAWTLRQVPGVERLRITVDGSPLDLPGEGSDAPVDTWSQYDPSVYWASQELFGVRKGRVVTVVGKQERRVSGVFGGTTYPLRSLGVDLSGQRIAGVTADGTQVLLAPRASGLPGQQPPGSPVVAYSGGTDLLAPSWDLYGQVWIVDRTRAGAVVSLFASGSAHQVDVPEVTGHNVTAFTVSRDGTRLVAVVSGPHGDRLVLARVTRDHAGHVQGVVDAHRLPVGGLPVERIRSLAWRTPASLALLTGPPSGTSQVVVARVDGSSALSDLATNTDLFRDDATRVVTSPAPGAPLYVATGRGRLFELAVDGRWTGTGIPPGLMSATFVG